ncbi:MAG: hypothetical protein E7380_00905 [Clostridiales bacterium]|nr:hypothetical protein [Clostridiales bacterium]
MKKLVCVLLCFAFSCGAFAACGESENEAGNGTENTTTHPQGTLTIIEGRGEVYPYQDRIKEWLLQPYGTDVADYYFETENQAQGIVLSWEYNASDATGFILCYGESGCSKEEKTEVVLGERIREYELFNLYKDTKYDWSVTVTTENGGSITKEESFKTTAIGPRTLQFEDIYNTRDVGGYVTESGKKTRQGLMLRGSEIPGYLREATKKELEPFGIKTDLDIRGYGEESGYKKESPIPGAELKYVMITGYMGAFSLTENYKEVFSMMANEENYPMYVHCTAGADRTGTVIFLVNALLGVPEELLIQDFEFTSFSKWGIRSHLEEGEEGYGAAFRQFLAKLKTYEGETLAEKTENYMLTIGVTQTEIESICAIMLET